MRIIAILLLVGTVARAEHLGIHLEVQAQPDSGSIEKIVAGLTAKATSDREKALALHRYGMAHLIHFNGPVEEREEYVTDPLKLIGVYGYALCGNNSDAMAALYNTAGLRARTRSMPEHSVPEVWFDGKWNYIDTDMFGYVFLPDGRIASVDELTADPDLFVRQKQPPDPFYPFDQKPDMASVFRNVRPSKNYHPYAAGHMMNLGLRTGESATLYYRPQGRFLLTTIRPANMGIVYKDYWVQGPIRKGSLAGTDRPPAAYGNGLLEYKPDLRSAAFRAENPGLSGASAGDGQQPELVASKRGVAASATVRVNSPWVIAGLQNDLLDFDDDTDGAVVSGLFWRHAPEDETRLLLSVDEGRSWKQIWGNTGEHLGAVPFQVDVTRHVKGRYAYTLKFEWMDRAGSGKVGLEKLAVRTWVALSPMALPRVAAGHNEFHFTEAAVETFYHESRWERGERLADERLTNLEFEPKGSVLRQQDSNKAGVVEFELGPEAEVEEVKFSIRARANRTGEKVGVQLLLSEDQGNTWRELARFQSHPEHDVNYMWFNHRVNGHVLDGGRARVRVSIEGGGIEKVIANSAVRRSPRCASALKVTHTWLEGEKRRQFSRVLTNGDKYQLDGGSDIRNESLRFEVVAKP